MCSRPSRSLKSTVTALIRFSSVRYLIRSSRILSLETRFLRCSFASRFRSSSSSYVSARKLRSSVGIDNPWGLLFKCQQVVSVKQCYRRKQLKWPGVSTEKDTANLGASPIEKADTRDKQIYCSALRCVRTRSQKPLLFLCAFFRDVHDLVLKNKKIGSTFAG